MPFSPIDTPFTEDEMLRLSGVSKRQFSEDREAGYVIYSCYHNGRDSIQFRLPNIFDIFSYVLFSTILPQHLENTEKLEYAERLTDFVAFFVEQNEQLWLDDRFRAILVAGIKEEIATWSAASNRGGASFTDDIFELAQKVCGAWEDCFAAARSMVEGESTGTLGRV